MLHDFHELLMIALCAVLSGGQGAVDMAVPRDNQDERRIVTTDALNCQRVIAG
jgi:hypothetical protein